MNDKEKKLLEKIEKSKKMLESLREKQKLEIGRIACEHNLQEFDIKTLSSAFSKLYQDLKNGYQ